MEFSVGDRVFLKLLPHRQQSLVRRINQKLYACYYGHFPIIAKVGSVAYKLQLSDSAKIHPIFHGSLLKRAVGNHPGMEMDVVTPTRPVHCLATRTVSTQGTQTKQWLIQWENGNAEEATWEDAYAIQTQFPDFRLEDKPAPLDGGIDREKPISPGPGKSTNVEGRIKGQV